MPDIATVKLYSLSTCSHCKSTKDLLDRHRVDADVIDVDRLEGEARRKALREVKDYNRNVSFPTLVIGEEVIVGYKADQIRKAIQNCGMEEER